MRKQTYCEPKYMNGYWLVEIIDEFVPNWFQRVIFRQKPKSVTHSYTNICDRQLRPSIYDWRHQPSGKKLDNLFADFERSLSNHVEHHIDRETLERLQEEEFQKGPHG